jgi:hypothetical protein
MNRSLEGLARSSGNDRDDDLSGTRLKFGCLCARGRLCRLETVVVVEDKGCWRKRRNYMYLAKIGMYIEYRYIGR